MYSEGRHKAKIGVVQIDIKGNSYRIRFTYPRGNRHEFLIAQATDEGWSTALRSAHLINRDIDLGEFDESYSRYSPKHAKALSIANKARDCDLLEIWHLYKEYSRDRVALTTQKAIWYYWERFLNSTDKELLRTSNADKFVRHCLSLYAVSSISCWYRTCLHPSVNYAIARKLITANAYSPIALPRQQKKLIECFTKREIKAIVAAFYSDEYKPLKSAFKHSHYAAYVDFLALTGCRPEEAIPLTRDDIKLNHDKMFVRFNKAYSNGILLPHTKTREIRLFPCNTQVARLLDSIKRHKTTDLLFPSQEMLFINQGTFRNNYWRPVIRGLVRDGKVEKYLKPYCLRHSFITRLVRSGIDIATVASFAGTSADTIVKHYLAADRSIEIPEL